MNRVVDSSGWLEYFSGSPRAKFFSAAIERTDFLVVPVISIYEVFKKIVSEKNESMALQAIAQMQLGAVVSLDSELALSAATLSQKYSLPMADSIILATAQFANAVLLTQDADFKDIPNVKFFFKK